MAASKVPSADQFLTNTWYIDCPFSSIGVSLAISGASLGVTIDGVSELHGLKEYGNHGIPARKLKKRANIGS